MIINDRINEQHYTQLQQAGCRLLNELKRLELLEKLPPFLDPAFELAEDLI